MPPGETFSPPRAIGMLVTGTQPTLYEELNAVLQDIVPGVQSILGDKFVGAYLHGSFAIGDFDIHSDVDFLVAIEREVDEAELAALQAMHGRIYDLDSDWAKHLEGSYFPTVTLRRHDPESEPLLYLDNTSRELVRSKHDDSLVVRWIVRECGVVLAGPAPDELIDSISADDLRSEVLADMRNWGQRIFANPDQMNNRWYQPFAVLSYCRMLQTLHTGRVESKPAAVRWAEDALDSRWAGLIQRAWDERPNPSTKVKQQADPDELKRTLEFIEYALAASGQYAYKRP